MLTNLSERWAACHHHYHHHHHHHHHHHDLPHLLRVDDLGEEELGEGRALGEEGGGGDGGAEHGHVLGPGHGDTAAQEVRVAPGVN